MPNRKSFNSNEEYNKWFREYRAKHALRMRSYNKEYNKMYRKVNGYQNEMNSIKNYPQKESARRKLRYAVRMGRIKREPCFDCGKEKYIQAHHEDYSKPLEVVWLCSLHHKDRHRKK